MLRRTLVEVVELAILVEKKLHVTWKNMVRCCLNKFESEYEDNANENKQYEKKHKKKSKKMNIDTIKEGVYCQNYFNEGHFTKECKLLMKFC